MALLVVDERLGRDGRWGNLPQEMGAWAGVEASAGAEGVGSGGSDQRAVGKD